MITGQFTPGITQEWRQFECRAFSAHLFEWTERAHYGIKSNACTSVVDINTIKMKYINACQDGTKQQTNKMEQKYQ